MSRPSGTLVRINTTDHAQIVTPAASTTAATATGRPGTDGPAATRSPATRRVRLSARPGSAIRARSDFGRRGVRRQPPAGPDPGLWRAAEWRRAFGGATGIVACPRD